MPYKLNGTRVAKASTGKVVPGGSHETKKQALAHLRALEINVSEAHGHSGSSRKNSRGRKKR